MPKIQMRRDTAANWKSVNPILLAGEWALETDTRLMKIGDGTTAYNALPYSTAEDSDEWQKPADWVDIRSGALPNSVYFLVGHSADYATYPTFVVKAGVSNSGTYDVFVDGIKQATTASGTETTLNWQTLALESGWDVTYPVALRTHIVRVTPTLSTNTIANISRDGTGDNGILWVHFQLTNAIIINNLLNTYDNKKRCPLCEAVTAEGNKITVGNSNCNGSFYAPNLKTIPVLDFNNATRTEITSFISATQLKSITLKNGTLYAMDPFSNCPNLRRIETENVVLDAQSNGKNAPLLENLIPINANPISPKRNPINYLEKLTGLKPCVLDFSNNSYFTRLTMGGTASYRINGLKGITVSNEAPFTGSSPQINVSYTGLGRAALINLFKSMPYNVGYTVVGSPTIVDGVASGFSSSDYLVSDTTLTSANNFEMACTFTMPNDNLSNTLTSLFIGKYESSARNGLDIYTPSPGTSYAHAYIRTIDNHDYGITVYTTTLQKNHTYTSKFYYKNGIYSIELWENGAKISDGGRQESTSLIVPTPIYVGKVANIGNAFPGSIDLNETYIKVNGKPWFTGKEAMTKTCNIVGCTGTAALTQDDKNIALNKGWELTVA